MNAPLIREAALDVINTNEIAFEKLHRMNAAYADMVDSAHRFDGSYEAARDRFNQAREMVG